MSQLIGNGSQPGDWEELEVFCVGLGPRGFKRKAGRSRVNRETHARIWGGLEVKFLRSTRHFNQRATLDTPTYSVLSYLISPLTTLSSIRR